MVANVRLRAEHTSLCPELLSTNVRLHCTGLRSGESPRKYQESPEFEATDAQHPPRTGSCCCVSAWAKVLGIMLDIVSKTELTEQPNDPENKR